MGRPCWLGLLLWLAGPMAWAQMPDEYVLYLELVVNEMSTERIVPVTYRAGRYFIDSEELRAVGVALDETLSGPQDLAGIDGLQSEYQQELQQLKLTLPSDWLPTQTLGRTQVYEGVEAQSSFGALLNYDVYYSDSDQGSRLLNGWLEQRLFGGMGRVSNTGVYRHAFSGNPAQGDGYLRYDTFWRYNDQPRMLSYAAGDLVTGALTWNRAVRIGGVQVSRNFGLRPDLITYPLPSFSGDAAVPTSVDLLINNSRVSSERLNPGPFTISSVPFISGAGSATVVTTDALGRQVATEVPFYVTNTLLQKGLYDYSLSAGKLRRDYGLESFSYGSQAASGTFRYGVSDGFTLESHGESGDDLRLGGLGGTLALGTWGTLGSSVSYSQHAGRRGQQLSLGYSYYSSLFGLAMQRVQRDDAYADLSVISALQNSRGISTLAKTTDQVTLSLNPRPIGNLGIGYFATQMQDGTRSRLVNLSWSRSLPGSSNLFVSLNREIGQPGYSALLQWMIPFDLRSTLSVALERDRNGGYRQRSNFGRSAPSDGGVGYNLAYAAGNGDPYAQADMTWRARHAQYQAGVYDDAGQRTYWGDVSGSVVAMGGGVYASNRIDDAFVLVSTDGHAGVPVSFEHQRLGETNARGHLLVPWVPSYYPGQYAIDPLGLPANIRTPEVERSIAVHEGSGAILDFQLRQVVAASIVLIDSRGEVLPRGSQASLQGSERQAIVGWDGLVYFEGLAKTNGLQVALPDGGQCRASFELDNLDEEIALVGPLTCR